MSHDAKTPDPPEGTSRRGFLACLGGGALGLMLGGCGSDAEPDRKPNIVIVLVDDLGWNDLGFMGHPFHETPNIDRLSRQGMVFSDAYANAPLCAPSRACLLTGQYPPRHGVYSVNQSGLINQQAAKLLQAANSPQLGADSVTFMEVLARVGYVGASIGKWHVGVDPVNGPLKQGFHLNLGGNAMGFPMRGYFPPYGNPNLDDGPAGEYLTDRLTDEAVAFIDENQDRPFLLLLSHFGVHVPLQAKPDLVRKYRYKTCTGLSCNPIYAAMVESVDQSVGRVMDHLEALGLSDNTLFIFTSDNGGNGCATKNAPLRGAKGTLYEGGLRVPLIVRWPGRIAPGTQSATPVIGIDLFPTLLEAARTAAPSGLVLDGRSLMPLLSGTGQIQRKALYWHFPLYMQNETCSPATWCTTPVGVIRKGRYKLMEFFEPRGTPCRMELYDLEQDRQESQNLSCSRPDVLKELRADMLDWRTRLAAPVPDLPNPLFDPSTEK